MATVIPAVQLKIKRVHPNAQIPKYQTDGAACFDLHSASDVTVIAAGKAQTVKIGLAFEIPNGHALMVYSRSGLGFNHGLRLCNSTGVVDADFRGELQVRLHNDSPAMYAIEPGERVAQAMLIKLPNVRLVEVNALSATARGAKGMGSTGV